MRFSEYSSQNPEERKGAHVAFDRDRLKSLDDRRRDIVHGLGPQLLQDVDADLSYMEFVVYMFWGLIVTKVPVPLDPTMFRT
jgi:hypothetical protein